MSAPTHITHSSSRGSFSDGADDGRDDACRSPLSRDSDDESPKRNRGGAEGGVINTSSTLPAEASGESRAVGAAADTTAVFTATEATHIAGSTAEGEEVAPPPRLSTTAPTQIQNQGSHAGHEPLALSANNATALAPSLAPARPRETMKFKVVVLGDYSVGKSSLIRQLTQRIFSLQSMATIGVEFKEYHTRIPMNSSPILLSLLAAEGGNAASSSASAPQEGATSGGGGGSRHYRQSVRHRAGAGTTAASNASFNSAIGGGGVGNGSLGSSSHQQQQQSHQQPVSVQIWDIAGQQYCSAMTRQYYRGAHAAIIVADLSKPSTFGVTLDWRSDFSEKAGQPALQAAAEALANMGATNELSASGGGGDANKNKKGAKDAKKQQQQQQQQKNSGGGIRYGGYELTAEEEALFTLPVFLFGNKSDLLPETARGPSGEGALVGDHAGAYDHILSAGPSDGISLRNVPSDDDEADNNGCSSDNAAGEGKKKRPINNGVVAERGAHDFAAAMGFAGSHVVSAKDYDGVVAAVNGHRRPHRRAASARGAHGAARGGGRWP